jgi:cellulose synthase/poly-beta-1,6-N-acetylglucosamine synthase-like glycosyltransferase
LVEYKQNIGKIGVLNRQIAAAKTDLIGLNDASALINREGLRFAAASFERPSVGVVFATYRLRESGSEGERAYTLFQTSTKAKEAALDSPIGGHGALYFFRKSAWAPMPADTINDDFILPMAIIASGKKGIYDERIVATEMERTQAKQEFRRRIRIGAGNMQQVLRLPKLASPLRPWLAFTFLSGKGLRPFLPFLFLYSIFVTAFLSISSPLHLVLLLILLAFLLLGALVASSRSKMMPKPLAWIGYLVEGHCASFIGATRILVGLPIRGWQPSGPVGLAR